MNTASHDGDAANQHQTASRVLRLLDLPTEMVSYIVDIVDDADLRNLRLTCKKLCIIASTPFAIVYVTERNHVISAHSIEALVEITAHPIFGPHVKTVTISAAYSGICDKGPKPGFGWRELIEHSGTLYTYDIAEALETTWEVLMETSCAVQHIQVSLWQHSSPQYMDPYMNRFSNVLETLFRLATPPTSKSLTIKLVTVNGDQTDSQLEFSKSFAKMLRCRVIKNFIYPDTAEMHVLMSYDFLSYLCITRLELSDCRMHVYELIFRLRAKNVRLTSIKFDEVSLSTLPIAHRSRWSTALDRLSSISSLEECRLRALGYSFNTRVIRREPQYPEHWTDLPFPDGQDEFVAKGDDVCVQLKHLVVWAEKEEEAQQARWERELGDG